MNSLALFRLPHATECLLVMQAQGEPEELASCADLTGRQGFVMAPFAPSARQPVLLIRPDRISRFSQDADESVWQEMEQYARLENGYTLHEHENDRHGDEHSRSDYHLDFSNFHAHLTNGDFQKLVLSRSVSLQPRPELSPVSLFRLACRRYPRMCISLVYTPKSGLWMAATPETLLSGEDGHWHTVALAGTMNYADNLRWSDKNIQEQRYVATYITRTLERFTADFSEEGPLTVRAGHLAHLRSDFHFTLPPDTPIGSLLQALHPTPAVCGLPKEPAFRFIRQYEHHERSYYSGFMGPLEVERQTHLFVTLRCMQLSARGYRLYAGGGLLKDSDEEQEWLETEAKLDTMRNLLSDIPCTATKRM